MAAQGGEPDQAAAGDAVGAQGKRSKQPGADLLQDERFAALFEDRSFAIDERSEEYRALHPNAGACQFRSPPALCALRRLGV
jgi:hypothetical protein